MQGDLQHEIIHLFRCTDQVLKRAIGRKVEGTGLYRRPLRKRWKSPPPRWRSP